MTVGTFLVQATAALQQAGVGTARLDLLVLLEDTLNTNRTHLLANPGLKITDTQLQLLNNLIKRRATHEPLAYIRGKTEFYGRELIINKHVLEPRPESETMIELLKSLPSEASQNIADIGTGSGALAITAALELPSADVIATDIDQHCIKVARSNARNLHADVRFVQCNLLDCAELRNGDATYTILANLPYVPDNFHINQAATAEPRLAIFGGPDGLDLYRTMFMQIGSFGIQAEHILTEALPPQHTKLSHIADAAGFELRKTSDFIQLFTRKS